MMFFAPNGIVLVVGYGILKIVLLSSNIECWDQRPTMCGAGGPVYPYKTMKRYQR